MQAFLRAIKEFPCEDCGKSYPYYIMDMDHRPNEEKLGEVAKIVLRGSWQKLLDEVMKCDVVCSNCHRERTFQRNNALLV